MFLFSKAHRENSRPHTPTSSTYHIREQAKHEPSPESTTEVIGWKRGSPTGRRSKTFSRGFLSFRKSRTVDPMLFKSMAGSSKHDLTNVEDLKRMYPEYDSNDPDHNPFMRLSGDPAVDQPVRGRQPTFSMSKVSNLRRRSLSNLRTPSPKRSFLRETTSTFLDSGAKTLRGWASYFHKQPSPAELAKDPKKTNVSLARSSPVPIPSTAPTLAPLEISDTPFQISENVPMTARPPTTPILGTKPLFSDLAYRNELCSAETDLDRASTKVNVSSFSEPLERMKPGQLDVNKLENPFDDNAGSISPLSENGEDHKGNLIFANSSCCTSKSANVSQAAAEKVREASLTSNTVAQRKPTDPNLTLRRAPAVRRSISPIRPRTTEEAVARFQKEIVVSDSESPAPSISDNGSNSSLVTDWPKRPTHEEIRVRFKGSSQEDQICKATFYQKDPKATAMHPRPLNIRGKQISSHEETSTGEDESTSLEKTASTSEPTSFSSRGSSPTRKFRFTNTRHRSTSPETVNLPDIIALDHEVNRLSLGSSGLNTYNRFAVLASRQQSESASESASETCPSANCKCNPCRCNPCKCGEPTSPERLHRQVLRSELSAISDLSDEEKHCVGII